MFVMSLDTLDAMSHDIKIHGHTRLMYKRLYKGMITMILHSSWFKHRYDASNTMIGFLNKNKGIVVEIPQKDRFAIFGHTGRVWRFLKGNNLMQEVRLGNEFVGPSRFLISNIHVQHLNNKYITPIKELVLTGNFKAAAKAAQSICRTDEVFTPTRYIRAKKIKKKHLQKAFASCTDDQLYHLLPVIAAYKSHRKKIYVRDYEDSNGRRHNIITRMPSQIRKILFDEWYDYDINASVQTFLVHEGLRHELDTHLISFYFNNKDEIRKMIAEWLGVPLKSVKLLFTSMSFGSKIPSKKQVKAGVKFTIVDALGKESAERFLSIKELVDIWNQMSSVGSKLVEIYIDDDAGTITNCIGKTISIYKKNGKRKSTATLLYHLYVGWERKVIDCVVDNISEYHTIHDGFISPEDLDTDMLSAKVYDQLGITVSFSKKRFTAA